MSDFIEQYQRFFRWYYYQWMDYAEGPVSVYGLPEWPSWGYWIVPKPIDN